MLVLLVSLAVEGFMPQSLTVGASGLLEVDISTEGTLASFFPSDWAATSRGPSCCSRESSSSMTGCCPLALGPSETSEDLSSELSMGDSSFLSSSDPEAGFSSEASSSSAASLTMLSAGLWEEGSDCSRLTFSGSYLVLMKELGPRPSRLLSRKALSWRMEVSSPSQI